MGNLSFNSTLVKGSRKNMLAQKITSVADDAFKQQSERWFKFLDYSLKINELDQSSQAGVNFFQLNSC